MPRASIVPITFLLVTCSGADGPTAGPPVCASCSTASLALRGELPDSVDELSGLVASRAHPGVYWGHNDDGAKTEVFAITTNGKLRSRHVLPATTCVDCEDIAIVPCPSGTCLLLGDIGDNAGVREDLALLRFPEPDPDGGDVPTGPVERFSFGYPQGHPDAEALIADPGGNRAWVVLKQPDRKRSAAVFRIGPLDAPGARLVAEPFADLSFPADAGPISGASVHPCAPIVLLRASNAVWQLAGVAGATLEAAFTAAPQSLPAAVEANGEAIAWRADGAGYLTAGEGKNDRISEASCR